MPTLEITLFAEKSKHDYLISSMASIFELSCDLLCARHRLDETCFRDENV